MTQDPAPEQERSSEDARPRVRLPWRGPPALAIAGFLGLLGVGVLFALEGRQAAPRSPSSVVADNAARRSPPPEIPSLEIPPPPPPPPPPPSQIVYVQRPAPPPIIQYIDRPQAPRGASPANQGAKLAEPVLPIDLAQVAQAASAQTGEDAPAEAIVLHNRSTLVPQGSMIPAVIESPINTDNPGPVRAVTTGDTRGFDGTRILIPRGSRLVGDIRGAGANADRANVVWTRLVRPDGVAIRFNSPATDPRGGVGVQGNVNNHILARVGSAVLESALTVGVLLASAQNSGSLVVGLPLQNAGGVAQAVLPPVPAAPTITVRAGAPIMIFVTRDLDFAGVTAKQ